jgi:TPR repeat protein
MIKIPMNKLYPIFILFLFSVFLNSCSILPTQPESSQRTKEQLKKSVVKIRSKRREGTGFVVGVSEGKAYIITVSHVVEGDGNPRIEFFGNKKLTAEVLDSESQENGLTLLSVEGQIPDEAIPLYLIKQRELNLGDQVFTFGFPRGGVPWAYDALSYSGQKRRNLQFSESDIGEGNSGCPVIKEDQVVAMITSMTQYAFAMPVESIREFLRGAKGGKRILNEMEKWNSTRWHKEYEVRLAKARQKAEVAQQEEKQLVIKVKATKMAIDAFDQGENDYDKQDFVKAVDLYRKAAELGHPKAQLNLGLMYFIGEGVPQNYNESAKWYRKAAEKGELEAIAFLLIMESQIGLSINKKLKDKWRFKLFERIEQGDIQSQLVIFAERMKSSGIKLYIDIILDTLIFGKTRNPNIKAAKFAHNTFKRLEQKEFSEWLSKIFELSKSEQQNLNALSDSFFVWMLSDKLFKNDNSVNKKIAEMVNQILNHAKQGDATYQLVLGYMYSEGIGVPKSDREAIRWIRNAAELGNVQAQKELESTQKSSIKSEIPSLP